MTWLLGAFAVLMLVGVGFSVAGVIRHELDLGRIKRNVRSAGSITKHEPDFANYGDSDGCWAYDGPELKRQCVLGRRHGGEHRFE